MADPAVLPVGEQPGLPGLVSYRMNGSGGAQALPAEQAAVFHDDGPAFAWLHMHRDDAETAGLLGAADLDPLAVEALMADETRPRCTAIGDGVILNLRGVNLNPGAEPEDMVSVRLWLDRSRVIGLWLRPLMAVTDVLASIRRGQAPATPGDLAARLALRLADRAEPSVAALNEAVDDMEEAVLEGIGHFAPSQLSAVRRAAIRIRRYMVPQRDALTTLEIEDLAWLGRRDRVLRHLPISTAPT